MTTQRLRGRQLQRRRALALQMLGPQCAICRESVRTDVHWRHPDYFHLDHRTPLARGGSDDPSDWQVVHAKCNLAKGSRIDVRPPVTFTNQTERGYRLATTGAWHHTQPCWHGECNGHSRPW